MPPLHEPELYHKYNEMQRHDVKWTIDSYWNKLQWTDGEQTILDVGCGTGDVAHDYIMPNLPTTYSHYTGIDTSQEMIEWARTHWTNPKWTWEHYDIAWDMNKQPYKHQPYDHIVSFYCLNWVQDQKRAHTNMWNLLKPGGDALWGLMATNPVYDIYKELSKDKKWAKYMKDVDQWTSQWHNSTDPAGEYKKALTNWGWTNVWTECTNKSWTYENSEQLKNAWTAVNPWYWKMTASEQEAYWHDYLTLCAKYGYAMDNYQTNPTACRWKVPYKWLVAYAKK